MLLELEADLGGALLRYEQATDLEEPVSIWCSAGVVRVAVHLGEVDKARAMIDHVDDLKARWPVGEWLSQASRAWLAAGESRTQDAIAYFRSAIERCYRVYERTELRLEAARLAADGGAVEATIGAFEQMGAARQADRARAIARELGMRPGRRRNRAGVLSAREHEVAQLIAAGYTNTEIAGSLYLSPRTVEHHVSNVLTKLGFRSRVQIAAEAAAGRLPGVEAATARPVP
jgi:DNA-binding NarL/FixJ family response regulator